MITDNDIRALAELLHRTPMSVAEQLYATGLMIRLEALTNAQSTNTTTNVSDGTDRGTSGAENSPRTKPAKPQ